MLWHCLLVLVVNLSLIMMMMCVCAYTVQYNQLMCVFVIWFKSKDTETQRETRKSSVNSIVIRVLTAVSVALN